MYFITVSSASPIYFTWKTLSTSNLYFPHITSTGKLLVSPTSISSLFIFGRISFVNASPFDCCSICKLVISNSIFSFASDIAYFSFPNFACFIKLFSPNKLLIAIPDNINKIIMVITNATNVIPLLFIVFLIFLFLSS